MRMFGLSKIMVVLSVVIFITTAILPGSENYVVQAASAIVINDQGCGLFDGDGGGVDAFSGHASRDHVVITDNNAHLKCSKRGVANSTGKSVRYDSNNNPLSMGLICNINGQDTLNWHETVSASGNATLTCKFP